MSRMRGQTSTICHLFLFTRLWKSCLIPTLMVTGGISFKKERKKETDCLNGKSVLCCLSLCHQCHSMRRRINTKLFFCAVAPTHTLCVHSHCFTHEISEMHRVSAFSLTFHHFVNVENNIKVFCS